MLIMAIAQQDLDLLQNLQTLMTKTIAKATNLDDLK